MKVDPTNTNLLSSLNIGEKFKFVTKVGGNYFAGERTYQVSGDKLRYDNKPCVPYTEVGKDKEKYSLWKQMVYKVSPSKQPSQT